MKICIFGAGATGGHLAARLAASGQDVCVVARGKNLEAIKRKGIRLVVEKEEILGNVRASESTAELGPQDIVIVTLKANQQSAFASVAAPLLGRDTGVVFAQNGIPWWYAQGARRAEAPVPDLGFLDPGGALARAVAPERVMGAVVFSANDLVAPGVVENHTPGNSMITVGEADDRASGRAEGLRAALNAAHLYSPPVPDIRESIWSKLLMNLGTSPLSVLAGARVRDLVEDAGLAGLRKRCIAEGRAVAAAYGIDVERAPKRPAGGHFAGATAHKPSILQDYENNRPMEIASQLVAPLAFARAAGVPTPTLDVLVPLTAHLAAARGLYSPPAQSG